MAERRSNARRGQDPSPVVTLGDLNLKEDSVEFRALSQFAQNNTNPSKPTESFMKKFISNRPIAWAAKKPAFHSIPIYSDRLKQDRNTIGSKILEDLSRFNPNNNN
jgi:hypothetical protein